MFKRYSPLNTRGLGDSKGTLQHSCPSDMQLWPISVTFHGVMFILWPLANCGWWKRKPPAHKRDWEEREGRLRFRNLGGECQHKSDTKWGLGRLSQSFALTHQPSVFFSVNKGKLLLRGQIMWRFCSNKYHRETIKQYLHCSQGELGGRQLSATFCLGKYEQIIYCSINLSATPNCKLWMT